MEAGFSTVALCSALWPCVWRCGPVLGAFCLVLCCVVLCCVALRCVALRCVALRCVALCCVVLCCVVLCCVVLCCVVFDVRHCIVQCCTLLYSELPRPRRRGVYTNFLANGFVLLWAHLGRG